MCFKINFIVCVSNQFSLSSSEYRLIIWSLESFIKAAIIFSLWTRRLIFTLNTWNSNPMVPQLELGWSVWPQSLFNIRLSLVLEENSSLSPVTKRCERKIRPPKWGIILSRSSYSTINGREWEQWSYYKSCLPVHAGPPILWRPTLLPFSLIPMGSSWQLCLLSICSLHPSLQPPPRHMKHSHSRIWTTMVQW